MTNKKKALFGIITALILIALGAAAFFFTRPKVVFVSDPLPHPFMKRLELPRRIDTSWRLSVKEIRSFSGNADAVIDISKEGAVTDAPVYRPSYDTADMFSPLLPELLGEHITYVYDTSDVSDSEFAEVLEEIFPDVSFITYEYEMDKSTFSVERGRLREDTVLMIPDLLPAIDFVRTIEKPRLALEWLDAAALETLDVEFIAHPDWDSIIPSLLSGEI